MGGRKSVKDRRSRTSRYEGVMHHSGHDTSNDNQHKHTTIQATDTGARIYGTIGPLWDTLANYLKPPPSKGAYPEDTGVWTESHGTQNHESHGTESHSQDTDHGHGTDIHGHGTDIHGHGTDIHGHGTDIHGHGTDSHGETDVEEDVIFPRYFMWLLFTVTLTFRLWYVSCPANWWVLHPDEIYQTMEVAHSELYGYGFRPYEYLPPPGPSHSNVTSEVRDHEINKGMYSMRSFLLPKLLAIVMSAGRVLVPDMSPYLVTKLFHVLLTSALPVSVYSFSLALRGSRDTAVLAAIFVSSSTTLNVFGTHTIVNSFLAPVLFYSLVPLIQVFTRKRLCLQNEHQSHLVNPFDQKQTYSKPYVNGKTTFSLANGHTNGCVDFRENGRTTNGHVAYSKRMQNGDVNGNIVGHNSHQNYKNNIFQNGTNNAYSNGYPTVNGRTADGKGYSNGIQSKLSNDTKYLKNGQNSLFNKTVKQRWDLTYNSIHTYILGVFLALCVYIRIDCAIIPATCMVVLRPEFIISVIYFVNELKVYIVGFITGVLIGGFNDHVMYGRWFLSPLQWFTFNVLKGGSSEVFGSMSASYYLETLLVMEPVVWVVFSVFIMNAIVFLKSAKTSSLAELKNQTSAMAFVFTILLLCYSLVGHKEFRFFHNAVVLMYIVFSQACFYSLGIMSFIKTYSMRTYFMYLFIACFVSSHMYKFACVTDSGLSEWSNGNSVTSNEVNVCLDFIRQQRDTKGVYIENDFYFFGGYSILHRNVSIMALHRYDIFEYSTEYRVQQRHGSGTIHLTLFWRPSEFISILNTPLVLKHLIRHRDYNYIVLPASREFIDIGYRRVFTYGNTIVLHRTLQEKDERTLWEKADDIPIGSNATLTEYEGYWLKRFGLLAKAERRLLVSNLLDPHRLGPFQILRDLFRKKGNETENVRNVIKACVQVHSQKDCYGSYVPIKLDSGSP